MEEKAFQVRFLRELIPVVYIKTDRRARLALKELSEFSTLVGLDTETCGKYRKYQDEGLSPILGKVRLLQVFNGSTCYLFDLSCLNPLPIYNYLLLGRFVAHNALFDIGMLKGSNFEVPNCGCTLLVSRLLIHEKIAKDIAISASLRDMVKRVFKEDVLKVLQVSNWDKEDLTYEQLEYAALDAICTLRLAEKLAEPLVSHKLDKVYKLYKESQYPIAEMQRNGIGFDVEAHREFQSKCRIELTGSLKEVKKLTGLDSITPNKMSDWLCENLPKDILETWPKTATGKLSTSSDTYENFSHLDFIAPILKFNEESKLLSTFGPKLVNFINPITKRIHPNYNIAGARTGRLSASKPNIQQMPRDTEFRNLFVPRLGNVLICADFSQIEVRIAAEISGDERMKDVYRRGADIYKETAAKILRKPLESINKLERQCAKAIILGSQFGLGPKKFVQYAKINYKIPDMTEVKATEFIEAYRKAYPTFRKWQLSQTETCKKTLKATTLMGKSRALDPDTYYGQALNHPIQGTAAEVILQSLVNFYKEKEESSLLIACVHDEILVEAPEDKASKVREQLSACMVEGFLKLFPSGVTTNLVEAKIGYSWGNAK